MRKTVEPTFQQILRSLSYVESNAGKNSSRLNTGNTSAGSVKGFQNEHVFGLAGLSRRKFDPFKNQQTYNVVHEEDDSKRKKIPDAKMVNLKVA